MQYFQAPNINFIGKRNLFFLLSGISLFLGIILIVFIKPELGIDFRGGIEIAVDFSKKVNTDEVRKAVNSAGLFGLEIKSYGSENQFLIRVKEEENVPSRIYESLKKKFPGQTIRIVKTEKDGYELTVAFSQATKPDDVTLALKNAGFHNSIIIRDEVETNRFLIAVQDAPSRVEKALIDKFKGNTVTILKVDKIGAKIGKELYFDAMLAVVLAIIAILIYIAFRFEFLFGLGAIVGLVHDVIFTFGVIIAVHKFGFINLELNQSILAALLTVIGYSINDTVIVFDRIRENREKMKGKPFMTIANTSINETLSRTINTVSTTLLVLLTLVLFGGPVLQGFAFTMTIGILVGTYSSVYVCSSSVVWYMQKVQKIDVEGIPSRKEASIAAKA